ncbi:MAG TPA: alpha/beta fold hydrolase [Patescibacteria group bacterium]|nr:alpha/beta fold hydrolase [Patescibacteria group bacterium]
MNKNTLAIIFIVVVISGLIYFFVSHSKNNRRDTSLVNQKVSPTPFPFQNLTIPYLRAKNYSSKLGELNFYANGLNYKSYLTSYNSDGFKINGLLTIPNGDTPKGGWPGIVFVHGYIPPSLYVTTERYVDYVDYLARNGYVVFKIDLRGNGESEGKPGGSYYSSDYVIDTLNARSALQNADFVNKNKVGLWGHSMAGNVVLRSLAVKPEIPAAVIWAGAGYTYADLQKYGLNDQSYHPPADVTQRQNSRNQIIKRFGSFDSSNEFWKEVAATNFLNDLKGAIELNHAVDDDVVNIGYSRDLNKLLDKTKVPHELHEYPSGGHNISGPSFVPAMENTVSFFNKYLK